MNPISLIAELIAKSGKNELEINIPESTIRRLKKYAIRRELDNLYH